MNGILISKDKAINSGLIWKRNGSCYLAWQCQSAAAKHAVLAWLRENGTDCRIIQKSGRLRGELERVFPSPPHPILPESGGHLHPAAAPLRPSSPWPLLGVVGLSSHMDCCRTTCHSSASSLVPPALSLQRLAHVASAWVIFLTRWIFYFPDRSWSAAPCSLAAWYNHNFCPWHTKTITVASAFLLSLISLCSVP